jgi:hypothetical protein
MFHYLSCYYFNNKKVAATRDLTINSRNIFSRTLVCPTVLKCVRGKEYNDLMTK